ncbi:hypothetical protein OKA06_13385 [Novosphingobium sp. MW5]|nr:hypothetical protein [Novosphingobium sp. MW5]
MHTDTKRWGRTHEFLERYPVGRSLAYRLLAEKKLRAKKCGKSTLWDFAAADEYFESLPDFEKAA